MTHPPYPCRECGTPFQRTYGQERYCSDPCRTAGQRRKTREWADRQRPVPPPTTRTCAHCGGPFPLAVHGRRLSQQRYCSTTCRRARQRVVAAERGYTMPPRNDSPPARARARARRHERRQAVAASAALGIAATQDEIAALLTTAKTCKLCHRRVTIKPGPRQAHIDHIVPLAAGGSHAIDNLRILCAPCNLGRPHDGSDVTGPLALWQTLNAIGGGGSGT